MAAAFISRARRLLFLCQCVNSYLRVPVFTQNIHQAPTEDTGDAPTDLQCACAVLYCDSLSQTVANFTSAAALLC